MTLMCAIAGHNPRTTHHVNAGLAFTRCHHCGCDLIRGEDGDWTEVPEGFHVVWREFGREGDAASVAERMQRLAPPPRRAPRNARPKPHRDRRGKPLRGAASMLGVLRRIGTLIADEADEPRDWLEADTAPAIRLPWRG